jgi:hypothetical protein
MRRAAYGGPAPSFRHPATDVPSLLTTLNRVTTANHCTRLIDGRLI